MTGIISSIVVNSVEILRLNEQEGISQTWLSKECLIKERLVLKMLRNITSVPQDSGVHHQH